MNKFNFIIYLLLVTTTLSAQRTYVPDDNFELALIDLGLDDALDNYVLTSNISGETSLNINNKNILDLTGIEGFTALKTFYCQDNNITRLDVSSNTALEYLNCALNDLSTLDVSSNTALIELHCFNNELSALNLNSNTALEILGCSFNELTSLNLSSNVVLKMLSCGNNELTSLDLGSNTALESLDCRSNELIVLDLSSNIALESLHSSVNNLIALNVNSNTSLKTLVCDDNELTSLNLFSNPQLEYLDCNSNELSTLNLSSNLALRELFCYKNHLRSLDLSSNLALQVLSCFGNDLGSLDLSFHTDLRKMECSNNKLTRLNLKNGNNRQIEYFYAKQNPDLTCIQVDFTEYSNANWYNGKDNIARYSEYCSNNDLSAYLPDNYFEQHLIDLGYDDFLDNYVSISAIKSIKKLDISKSSISDLTGIEYFTALETLYCQNNKLIQLDLSSNTALTALDCSSNQLESLNLKNEKETKFTALNTTKNSKLYCIQVDKEDISYLNKNSYTSKHINFDKHAKISESCTEINKTEDADYNIFPNPVCNILTVKSIHTINKITVINLQGIIVLNTNKQTINFSSLKKGIYILRLENKGGTVFKQVVKN
ncbi:MAG: T9SS type A sorting domain-containing protein [Algibacter sp.]|uniref:T9SS type A sorting domain-containing protein n=1 Tax=Algibacter sp. TaxID=1872428 RepID=UPI0032977FFF